MRVALMIEGQEGVDWEDWRALAAASERHGYDGLFRSDHYLSLMGERRVATDAWSVVSALAAITDRLTLGTLVSPVTFRHPAVVAKMAMTAAMIAPGRIELGMGAGWNEREHRAYGLPFPPVGERYDRFEEDVAVVRALLDEETVDHRGARLRLEQAPGGLAATPPRLLIGGDAGRRSARIAAAHADEYNTLGGDLGQIRSRRATLEEAWEDAGRDPGALVLSVMTGAIVAEDREGLRARTRAVLDRTGSDGDPDAFVDERRASWIIGTVDEVVDRLGELGQAGVDRIMLQHLPHHDLEMVDLVGERILPSV